MVVVVTVVVVAGAVVVSVTVAVVVVVAIAAPPFVTVTVGGGVVTVVVSVTVFSGGAGAVVVTVVVASPGVVVLGLVGCVVVGRVSVALEEDGSVGVVDTVRVTVGAAIELPPPPLPQLARKPAPKRTSPRAAASGTRKRRWFPIVRPGIVGIERPHERGIAQVYAGCVRPSRPLLRDRGQRRRPRTWSPALLAQDLAAGGGPIR
ncbi:MAG TPA: hypothetical protein VFK76_08690 [Gaiellaceae bacterium]|nr:hypothetical protein [Gaiellaceae bacterium]